MKLEDCKPGTRVRIYTHNTSNPFEAEIERVLEDGRISIKLYDTLFFPQQLRKLVKRKRPVITIAYSACEKDLIYAIRCEPTQEDVTHWKSNGCEIWVMRGVKRL